MTLDVFGIGDGAFVRDAAIAAAADLGIYDVLARSTPTLDELAEAIGVRTGRHRLRALIDVLAAIGIVARGGDRLRGCGRPVALPPAIEAGWGRLAEVIRHDRPLVADTDRAIARCHDHLARAGADAARELVARLGDARSLLDLGGGAGAYTAAFLAHHPEARATLVDSARVVSLAGAHLASFGARVRLIAGDARDVEVDAHDVVLLSNVLHLHPATACAELCAAAARRVAPGGAVIIKDFRVDDDRSGPLPGLMFALNMAVYSDGGDVYEVSRIRSWLDQAGLTEIEVVRLQAAPDSMVIVARRPATGEAVTRAIEHELDDALARSSASPDDAPQFPSALRRVLARAIAIERTPGAASRATIATGLRPDGEPRDAQLIRHYTETMPRMRNDQRRGSSDPNHELFHVALDWNRLPRLTTAIARLYAVLDDAGVAGAPALGADTAVAFRDRTRTLSELYGRTHYGGVMPLLYGYPADLAYFARRASERGFDALATIDRYLTAPIVHELCHFARDRDAIEPPHLDECIGGWLGVHIHPEFAYPAADEDDAICAAPWLAQVGQAIARAFGVTAIVRAHAGAARWSSALSASFVAAARRLGWDDWRARRSLHLLSDAFDPTPWIALALTAAAGRSVSDATLGSLADTPLHALADGLPFDPEFDLAIVRDALRAMCLEDLRIGGSLRTRTRLAAGIAIDAWSCRVTARRDDDVAPVTRSYWLPPAVAARLIARGITAYSLELSVLEAIPDAARAIANGSNVVETAGFALVARRSSVP